MSPCPSEVPNAALAPLDAPGDEMRQPAGLPVGVDDGLALVEPEPAELVEHQHAAAPQLDHRVGRHPGRRLDPRWEVARGGAQGLDVVGDDLVDHQAVRPDPGAAEDALHPGRQAHVDVEGAGVVPDELVDLLGRGAQGDQVEVLVAQAAGQLGRVRIGVEGGLGRRGLGGRREGAVEPAVRHPVLVDDPVSGRGDPEGFEGALQQAPVVVVVVGREPTVGGQDGVDDVGELELDRRQVVQGTQQHGQEVLRRLHALLGDPAGVQAATPLLTQGREPARPHGDHRLHERRHEDLGATVRLGVRRVLRPGRGRGDVDGPAQGGVAPGHGGVPRVLGRAPAADLLGEPGQRGRLQHLGPAGQQLRLLRVGVLDPPGHGVGGEPHLAQLPGIEEVLGDALDAEHREQSHQVGERLVEGQLVGQARLGVAGPQPVEDRVADLVGDHVVGQRRVERRLASEAPGASRTGRRCAHGSRTRWPRPAHGARDRAAGTGSSTGSAGRGAARTGRGCDRPPRRRSARGRPGPRRARPRPRSGGPCPSGRRRSTRSGRAGRRVRRRRWCPRRRPRRGTGGCAGRAAAARPAPTPRPGRDLPAHRPPEGPGRTPSSSPTTG